jgi:BirA family biotin operon repressor/biotin-[acetyl-CoA-carboxylase] ligase
LGRDDVTIKWPNDLMRGERKIGGMLVETTRSPDGTGAALLGFGLNLTLRSDDLPVELWDRTSHLGLAEASARERYLAAWLLELDAALAEIDTAADAERGAEFRRRSWLTGRRVELSVAGVPRCARVADVTVDGDLVLDGGETLQGELVELLAVLDPR